MALTLAHVCWRRAGMMRGMSKDEFVKDCQG